MSTATPSTASVPPIASAAASRRWSTFGFLKPGRYQGTTRMPAAWAATTSCLSGAGLTTSTLLFAFAVST